MTDEGAARPDQIEAVREWREANIGCTPERPGAIFCLWTDEDVAKYASSSNAALLEANQVIRRQLQKVCDQVTALEEENATWLQTVKVNVEYRVAAEDKAAALQQEYEAQIAAFNDLAEQCRKVTTDLLTVRDSRDRLQEALREQRKNAIEVIRIRKISGTDSPNTTNIYPEWVVEQCDKALNGAALGDPEKESNG